MFLTPLVDWGLMKETGKSAHALAKLGEDLARYSGQDYLDKFTEFMGSELNVDIATIAFLTDEGENLHTVSLWWDGKHVENFKYPIDKAPCAESVSKEFCLYQSMLQSHFPEDEFLVQEQLNSYIGFPLIDADGEVFGVVNAANRYDVEQDCEQFVSMKQMLTKLCAEAALCRQHWSAHLAP
ncbi:MAG: GAF domain-containing protein [Kordiimonas sp.]